MNGILREIGHRASDLVARMSAEVAVTVGNQGTAAGDNLTLVLLLVVGLGVLLAWGLNMRRRQIRAAALAEARGTLHVLIGTHGSALLSLHATAADDDERAWIEGAADSLVLVDHLVCSLSEETLLSAVRSPRVAWALSDSRKTPLLDFRRN